MADRIDNLPAPGRKALDDGHQDSESFTDDAVGARKSSEAQRQQSRDRVRDSRESTNRLRRSGQTINSESIFSRARDGDQQRKTKTFRDSGAVRSDGLPGGRARVGKDGRIRTSEVDDDLRVQELMGELSSILSEIEEAGLDTLMKELESDPEMARAQAKDGLGKMTGPMASRLNKLNRMLRRLHEAEFKARMMLQQVLTGGTGVELLNDPRLTFKRLFDRLKNWPRRVPPGRRPETTEDFDVFISWVFLPPDYPEEMVVPDFEPST